MDDDTETADDPAPVIQQQNLGKIDFINNIKGVRGVITFQRLFFNPIFRQILDRRDILLLNNKKYIILYH